MQIRKEALWAIYAMAPDNYEAITTVCHFICQFKHDSFRIVHFFVKTGFWSFINGRIILDNQPVAGALA